MRKIMVAAAFAAFGMISIHQARGDDGPESLVGGYTIVSGEKDGEKEPADRIKGTTVRIALNGIVVTTPDKKEVFVSSYEIDTSKKPWHITLKSKLSPGEGEVAKGLIEKDGDTVKLIYALPGGETPTEFKTKAKQLMFVMKNKSVE